MVGKERKQTKQNSASRKVPAGGIDSNCFSAESTQSSQPFDPFDLQYFASMRPKLNRLARGNGAR